MSEYVEGRKTFLTEGEDSDRVPFWVGKHKDISGYERDYHKIKEHITNEKVI